MAPSTGNGLERGIHQSSVGVASIKVATAVALWMANIFGLIYSKKGIVFIFIFLQTYFLAFIVFLQFYFESGPIILKVTTGG